MENFMDKSKDNLKFRTHFVLYTVTIAVCTLLTCACVTTPQQSQIKETVTTVDDESFESEVLQTNGPVIVLFHDNAIVESQDMQKRFDYFSERYADEIKFLTFNWNSAGNTARYNLNSLPSTVFYYNGDEIDRIGGIPEDGELLREWNKDIDLWILKTVLGLQGDDYAGRYVYKFNDTAKLHISNY